MPRELKTQPGRITDNECVQIALDEYKREHGFGEMIRVGDLPLTSISDVMRRAQQLKERARQGAE